ncbi:MAG: hypothetical protein QJR09_11195 [Micrococcus sp.]|nr:hypothetical protein [Micrococcus sp.]
MQAVESGSPRHDSSPGSRTRNWASRGSGITFAVMVVVLLVALLFAANQNDVIGWLLVVISAGWLLLAVLVVRGVRRGAKSVDRRMKDMSASLAPRAPESATTRVAAGQAAADPMRDTKLDHSLKIVQVQTRVVTEELDKGGAADSDMIARALETIHITAANARDMLKEPGAGTDGPGRPASGAGQDAGRGTGSVRGSGQGAEGPISGEVIN